MRGYQLIIYFWIILTGYYLAAVCRRWRLLLQSIPALWQNLLIFIGKPNDKWSEESLEYHLKLSNGNIRQLTITSSCSRNAFPDVLKAPLIQIKFVESLRCDYTRVSWRLVDTWWSFCPPMQELYISDFTRSGMNTKLPSRLCASIKKVVTMHVVVSFEATTPLLEELRMRDPPWVITEWRRSEIWRVMRANGGNLRILEVTGSFGNVEDMEHNELDQDSLSNLQDITMTMGTLVTLKCRLPNLHTPHLLGAIDSTLEAWERFLAISNRRSTIQAVYFDKLPTDVPAALDPFIAELKNENLEVYDESGEYILVKHPTNRSEA